ncbi:MAG: alpha/beta hydrolase [Alphaproteobacteria bacterium]|nr:alpha/beta hydrolase [Alphaproteobacteria bacterium]
MHSKHLVDPELQSLLDVFPTVQFGADMLPALRANVPEYARAAIDPSETDLTVHHVDGPAGAGSIEVWFYRPHGVSQPLPCLLHIHGGGFVVGDAAHLEPIHRRMSAKLKCCILSVNYRLAPETRSPGQVEDCYAALTWLVHQASDLGVDPASIGVGGESAGGGLAAALALLVRDRGEYRLKFQHLIYPMLDDRTCVDPAPHAYAGEYIWTPGNNVFGWTSLLGSAPGGADVPIYAAPARALDLAGLPPTFLAVGALDLFIDENIDYGRRLIRAGVPVELHVYPGAFHAFDVSPTAAVANQMRKDSFDALARALAR